jgi:serine protease Do
MKPRWHVRISLVLAIFALLVGGSPTASAQLTPEKRAELRKKVEEQLKEKPFKPGVNQDEMKKLQDQLDQQLETQRRAERRAASQASLRKSSPGVLGAFREVVAAARDSTFVVRRNGKDVGLGAVVGANGWILTKASELKVDDYKTVVACRNQGGREFPARVIGIHEDTDLAMLKIEASGLKPLEWRTGGLPSVGDWVATVGSGETPAAVGVVSVGPRRVYSPRGVLGIGLEPSDQGPRITLVNPGSGAAKAGLVAGDVIRSVNDQVVKTHEELVAVVARYKPGDTLSLVILRSGKEQNVKATLAAQPNQGRSLFQNALGGALSERRSNFPRVLQHDSVLKPTECGGPLVDLDGRAVGINIARAGRVESYAIPAEEIVALVSDLQSGRLAPPPPIAEFEKQLAEALASLKAADASVQSAKSELDKVVNQAQAALKNVEAARSAAEKAVQNAQQALEQAKANAKPQQPPK